MIHDVKPPLDLPFNLFWVIVFSLLFLIILVGIIFCWRKRKKTAPAAVIVKSPWEKAYEALSALEKSTLLSQLQFKEFYSQLSDIVRHYLEERFHYKAPEMTTEEFLLSLKGSDQLNEKQKDILKEFLTSCDMVKFAKYVPVIEEAKKSLQLARQLVGETKI